MADEPRDETDAAPTWPELRGLRHADQVRAVLAGMPHPRRPVPGSAIEAPAPVATVQVLERAETPDAAELPELEEEPAPLADEPGTSAETVETTPLWETPTVFDALRAAPPVVPPPWDPGRTVHVAPPPLLPTDAGMGPLTVASRRHRLRRVLVVVLALALVAGAAGGALYWRSHRQAAPTWDPRVLSIVQFVEHQRGLQFTQPVAVQFLSDAAFDQAVRVPQPSSSHDRTTMADAVRALRALGLVTGTVNLATSLDHLSQADVVGLYRPDKKTVFVRGTAMTPFVRVTLAHELTHALQDQYYGLDRLQSSVQGADDSALTALIEGDATRVENAYRATLSSADEQTYEQELQAAEHRSGQATGVPAVLSDMAGFPYAFGVTYVDALVAKGGTAALAGAFHDPPRAQAQILDPVSYPVGWHAVPVARPVLPAGARVLDTASPFGQAMLFEVLGSRVGYDRAWSAVQGWQGDNSVPYSVGGKTCVAVDVRMGSVPTAAALTAAGSAWAAASRIPGATVTQAGTLVSLRSCDPGVGAQPPPPSTPSAFDVLAARSAFIDGIMSSGPAGFGLARCVADSVIAQVGPAGYGELTAATLTPAQQQSLLQLAGSAAARCQAAGTR